MTNKIDKMFFIEEKIVKGKYPLSGTKPETQSKMLHLQPYIFGIDIDHKTYNIMQHISRIKDKTSMNVN